MEQISQFFITAEKLLFYGKNTMQYCLTRLPKSILKSICFRLHL